MSQVFTPDTKAMVKITVNIKGGTPPINIIGNAYLRFPGGELKSVKSFTDIVKDAPPVNRAYTVEFPIGRMGPPFPTGSYTVDVEVALSNQAGSSVARGSGSFWLDVHSFTVTFIPASDTYARYAGIWIGRDPGPDFWQKGEANLGVIAPPYATRDITLNRPQGAGTLYVRVSTPCGYDWDIAVAVDGQDLGKKRTNCGLAIFGV